LATSERRYVYCTQGVCAPEIHFQTQDGILVHLRFVGGGCPGNAQMVSRLLPGRPVDEAIALAEGILCRNDTSCADQLARALNAVKRGDLAPARSFQVFTDPIRRSRVGVIGELGGRSDVLRALIPAMRQKGVEAIYCLGNLTGAGADMNVDLLRAVRKEGVLAIAGEQDWCNAQEEPGVPSSLDSGGRDYLLRLPQVLSFQIGNRKVMGFFGQYVVEMPGFSDFEPYALEMNLVCRLSQFLQDQTVFPALAAMTPQFTTRVVLFSQPQNWGHWEVGGVHFMGVGRAWTETGLAWGLLEGRADTVYWQVEQVSWPSGG
jgi:uncharacterized protein (TIGR03905 family)